MSWFLYSLKVTILILKNIYHYKLMNLNIFNGFKDMAFLIFIQTQVVPFLANRNFLKLAAESFWHDPINL